MGQCKVISTRIGCIQGKHRKPIGQLRYQCIAILFVMELCMSTNRKRARLTMRVLRFSVVLTQFEMLRTADKVEPDLSSVRQAPRSA